MATECSDPAVLARLFLAAYSGELAVVKALLQENALSADVSDPIKVRCLVLYFILCRSIYLFIFYVFHGWCSLRSPSVCLFVCPVCPRDKNK